MKTRIRRIAGFAAAVLIVQTAALLFLTPMGLEVLFPPAARVNAEKFSPGGNTYAVYYDIRAEVAGADLIVVGIDYGIAESYDLLGHFTRFAKQYNNFSAVITNMSVSQQRVAENIFRQSEEKDYQRRITVLRERTGMSSDYCDYIAELFLINRTMTEIRKLNVLSYAIPTDDEYVENADRLSKMSKAERVMYCADSAERSSLCAVDCADLTYGSEFRTELDALCAERDLKVMYLQVQYSGSCADGDGHPTYRFPDYHSDPAFFFVENEKVDLYYRYYSTILGSNRDRVNDPLDTRYTDYYFVITNGTNAE